jgi:hypothetical protein
VPRTISSRFAAIVVVALATLAGCSVPQHFIECQDDTSCGLHAGGRCLTNDATAHKFCAYPDQTCPDGYRWSDSDVESSISGACVAASVPDAGVSGIDAGADGGSGPMGEALWFDQVGDVNADHAYSVRVDANGYVYVVGSFSGTVMIGGKTLTGQTQQDMYVAKLDGSTGTAVWAFRFGATSSLNPRAVGVDGAGDVIATGSFSGTLNFGGTPLTGDTAGDIFLVKLSGATGAYVWSKSYGSSGTDLVSGLAVDSNHDIVIVGSYKCAGLPCQTQPTLTFGGATFTNAGDYDGWIAKLSGTNGGHIWSAAFGSTGHDFANGVAVAGNGDVAVTGSFSGTVNFGDGPRSSAGLMDIFIARYSSAGTLQYTQRYGSTGDDQGNAVSVGTAGQTFFLGTFSGTVNFGGPTPLTANGSSASVVAKYTLAGANAWAETFDSTGTVLGADVGAIPGAVVVIASFCGSVTLGTQTLSSATACPDYDILVTQLADTDGTPAAAVRHGGTGSEIGASVSVASDGRIFTAGSFTGFAEFGGNAYQSKGSFDGFILGMAPLK